MFTVGAIIDRPQTTAKPKRATNGRPYKRISAEILFSLQICGIMGLAKSLSLWERWRRSRRRGQIVATTTLSPATAGALPKGEPKDTCIFRGMGFAKAFVIQMRNWR